MRPKVLDTHRTYGMAIVAAKLMHLALFIEFTFAGAARHSSPAMSEAAAVISMPAWGSAHLLVALLLGAGMYLPGKFWLVRFGFRVSVTLFASMAAVYLYAATVNELASFAGAIIFAYLSYLMLACALAPEVIVEVSDGARR